MAMIITTFKRTLLIFCILYFEIYIEASSQNITLRHVRRTKVEEVFFKNQKENLYRSFQPISIKNHETSYVKADDRTDDDITSYDTEYNGVVSNFTSSVYDDNPPLYPNPDNFPNNEENNKEDNEVDSSDETFADTDLKQYNRISSQSYLYGCNGCHDKEVSWILLIYVNNGLSLLILGWGLAFQIFTQRGAKFRRHSRLFYPVIHLYCCFIICTLLYNQAITGESDPRDCQELAMLLHYMYLTCGMWIGAITYIMTEYLNYNYIMPMKLYCLVVYATPVIFIALNNALATDVYEVKHFCWLSIEKGLVFAFMVPGLLLIVGNTILTIFTLPLVRDKLDEALDILFILEAHKVNELKSKQVDNNNKDERNEISDEAAIVTKEVEGQTLNRNSNAEDNCNGNKEANNHEVGDVKITISVKSNDNDDDADLQKIWSYTVPEWKKDRKDDEDCNGEDEGEVKEHNEVRNVKELESYMHFVLVMGPLFAVNWVLSTAAIEHVTNCAMPILFLVLNLFMYTYFVERVSSNFPILPFIGYTDIRSRGILYETPGSPPPLSRTSDDSPLLNSPEKQSQGTPDPANTISTISN